MPRKSEFCSNVNRDIGYKIRELRTTHKMILSDLSLTIGVSRQQLSKYEHGTDCVSPARLILIAKAFNKPVAYFFEGITS